MINFKTLISAAFFCLTLTNCNKEDVSKQEEIQDIDGNSYEVVQIGQQLWMAENLKTTKYNDGIDIPYVPDNEVWPDLETPAFCWFNNDANNKIEYGGLYNWFVVSTGKVCPEGWHVPSDEEWTELEIYLENSGYNFDGSVDDDNDRKTNNKIGKAMASSVGWELSGAEGAIGNSDYTEYRNLSGFNAMPGGYRDASGFFWYLNQTGNYWSAAQRNNGNAWYRRFLYSSVKVIRDVHAKMDGFSIRCLKDNNPD